MISIESGGCFEQHEIDAAEFLVENGYSVALKADKYAQNKRSNDAIIDGLEFELKSPITSKPRTIKKQFYRGMEQAKNIVFDLRRVTDNYEKVEERVFEMFGRTECERLIVITKNGKIITRKRRNR